MASMKLALAVMAGVLIARGGPAGAPGSGDPDDLSLFVNPRMRVVFYAVLEGLYEDGVSTEDTHLILGGRPGDGRAANFIPGCPLCIPAVEALRIYAARPPLRSFKGEPDTFGKGLAPEVRKRLRSTTVRERFDQVQALISGWVERRLGAMRLTAAERAAYQITFMEARKLGMTYLAEIRSRSAADPDLPVPWGDVGECAACNAAVEAAGRNR